MNEPELTVKLTCDTASDPLDAGIEGSLVNSGTSAIDVTVSSEPFPFEVELLNEQGNDLLAKHRRPATTERRAGAVTQTVRLEPNEQKTFRITLAQYLDSRGLPRDVDAAAGIRLYVAASINNSGAFSVFRSNVAALKQKNASQP